jgi:hypothetical protein
MAARLRNKDAAWNGEGLKERSRLRLSNPITNIQICQYTGNIFLSSGGNYQERSESAGEEGVVGRQIPPLSPVEI